MVLFFAIFVIVAISKAIMVVRQTQHLSRGATRAVQPHHGGRSALPDSVHRQGAQGESATNLCIRSLPQSVITSDNLVVDIDSVIYFQVTGPKRNKQHHGC